MGDLGALGASIASVSLLLARSRRSGLVPAPLVASTPVRRLMVVAACGFAALAAVFFRARHGGGASVPLVITALIAVPSVLVLMTAVSPRAVRALAVLAVLATGVAVVAGGLHGD